MSKSLSGWQGLSSTDPRHGTMNGYSNYGCRCERCKEAQRANWQRPEIQERFRNWRRKRGVRPREEYLEDIEPSHGTEGRYTHRCCRCAECKAASATARRRRRAREAERG